MSKLIYLAENDTRHPASRTPRHLDVPRGADRFTSMSPRPFDTTLDAWRAQQDALSRIGPAARVQVAVELSDAVREIQIEGVRARHPGWDRGRAVRHIVQSHLGIDLSDLS